MPMCLVCFFAKLRVAFLKHFRVRLVGVYEHARSRVGRVAWTDGLGHFVASYDLCCRRHAHAWHKVAIHSAFPFVLHTYACAILAHASSWRRARRSSTPSCRWLPSRSRRRCHCRPSCGRSPGCAGRLPSEGAEAACRGVSLSTYLISDVAALSCVGWHSGERACDGPVPIHSVDCSFAKTLHHSSATSSL